MADLNLEQGLAVLDGRTRWVRILIFAYIVASLATVAGQLGEVSGMIELDAAEGNPAANPLILMAVGVAYLGYAGIFIASIVLVSMWIYRAHANVRAAGAAPLEVTPGWAVGWFFIPIANLFKPFQAMRELWNASHARSEGYAQESDPLLKLWWGFWIVSNIVTNIGARNLFSGEPGAQAANPLDIAGGLLSIPAAWFLLQIVTRVNSAQRSTLAAASTFS